MPDLDHVIIGTAGHIDHGKSALVRALTGTDPDTLPEEKARGMTIELGFVFLDDPESPKQIVFIDVPGHEKFVRTMAAGASHIDAALFVIAADEGIAVQTREHFDILRLLDIRLGAIALTKCDLVDGARLAELTASVRHFVRGSFLAEAPVLPVSALTGAGLDELRSVLRGLALRVQPMTMNSRALWARAKARTSSQKAPAAKKISRLTPSCWQRSRTFPSHRLWSSSRPLKEMSPESAGSPPRGGKTAMSTRDNFRRAANWTAYEAARESGIDRSMAKSTLFFMSHNRVAPTGPTGIKLE